MYRIFRHLLVYNRPIPPPYVLTLTTSTINCLSCRSISNITVVYPHQTDTVQINALEYDPDIYGDNQPNTAKKHVTVSVQETPNTSPEPSLLEDDNSIAPDNSATSQNQQETNWPVAPAIQIPDISSTTLDQPPEVMCNRSQVQPSAVYLNIPELEEDSDQDQFADLDTFITHHNTHQESEWI